MVVHRGSDNIESLSPVDGQNIASVETTDRAAYDHIMEEAQRAFIHWREIPAPQRGEIVRQFGEKLREKGCLRPFGELRNGKISSEGLGECRR